MESAEIGAAALRQVEVRLGRGPDRNAGERHQRGVGDLLAAEDHERASGGPDRLQLGPDRGRRAQDAHHDQVAVARHLGQFWEAHLRRIRPAVVRTARARRQEIGVGGGQQGDSGHTYSSAGRPGESRRTCRGSLRPFAADGRAPEPPLPASAAPCLGRSLPRPLLPGAARAGGLSCPGASCRAARAPGSSCRAARARAPPATCRVVRDDVRPDHVSAGHLQGCAAKRTGGIARARVARGQAARSRCPRPLLPEPLVPAAALARAPAATCRFVRDDVRPDRVVAAHLQGCAGRRTPGSLVPGRS